MRCSPFGLHHLCCTRTWTAGTFGTHLRLDDSIQGLVLVFPRSDSEADTPIPLALAPPHPSSSPPLPCDCRRLLSPPALCTSAHAHTKPLPIPRDVSLPPAGARLVVIYPTQALGGLRRTEERLIRCQEHNLEFISDAPEGNPLSGMLLHALRVCALAVPAPRAILSFPPLVSLGAALTTRIRKCASLIAHAPAVLLFSLVPHLLCTRPSYVPNL